MAVPLAVLPTAVLPLLHLAAPLSALLPSAGLLSGLVSLSYVPTHSDDPNTAAAREPDGILRGID